MFRKINYLIIICFCLKSILGIENSVWNYHLSLDPHQKYSLKWNINKEEQTITFLSEVKTRGWFGFGLSPNGGMKGSDLIIGWIDDSSGLAHFNDRYAFDESLPQIDESQDWYLLDARQNSSHTIFKFYRSLTSCDKEFDRDITRDTIRLMYAFNDNDPKSDSDIRMHGRHQRGTRSVLLMTQPDHYDNRPQETDLQTFILNITIPKKETTYWCKIFKIPDEKIHVVKFSPFITPGNEAFAHHISIYVCFHPNSELLEKHLIHEGVDCTDSANMPKDFYHCFNPYFMWAVGGGDFLLPKDVGFPIGDTDSSTYLMLNTHYDNPEMIEGVIDSSGLEFYYTRSYRKYEAFTLSVGSTLDNRIFIPPNQNSFHISGHCHTDCFQNKMDPDGLKVFALWPHAHILGTKIKTRHFRDNEELPWIEFDQSYDFNLQSFRRLDPMIEIKSGDQITVECEYNSIRRNTTTFGGFGTYDEMCCAFLYYYPRMTEAKPCLSRLDEKTIRSLAGIEDKTQLTLNSGLTEHLAKKQHWNQTVLNKSYQIMQDDEQTLQCYWFKTDNDIELNVRIGYPKLKHLYKPKDNQCISNSNENHDIIYSHFVRVFIIGLIAIIIAIIIVLIILYLQKRNSQKHNRLV